ncbi:bifunctional acetate--CoA ligase family protein/GNAT family N-acetyltransferase [Solemya velum gill symbiont]|uniref:bifunctional acetate--CoA ligase family protein/GNAT family N-acetyltransferase n=1 Tax=Solemya velum gill symbiont TaxID=2340 RepID=UPI00099702E9|nr:bifunctional acetate--CoA ligase family protein/GNAT family N-acetyltransferase [Solemya velum gill symbiont]OOZ45311.1 GNAT family N-acetyltransferase [Solemya velum gill symbiont]
MKKHYLSKLFEPDSIAIIGASESEGSVGGQVLRNLLDSGFGGALYPVNPKHDEIMGLSAYKSVSGVDHTIELAVIATPAKLIPGIMQECADHGVAAVIVISAGFAEIGKAGLDLQNEIVDIARTYDIPLIGPNCLGIVRPRVGLNATFAKSPAKTGELALVAQSGAFCTALLDWADTEGFGFSAVASLGATADIGFGEVLDYLAVDPETRSILLYIEGITDTRSFMSGLRVAARLKPVIVVKSGRNDTGTKAAVSHTGAMAGSDNVFDSAVKRAGAVRVKTVAQLFAAAKVLASGTRVSGSRLAIITNGGGPGVMAADRAHDIDVPLAEMSQKTYDHLDSVLPPFWSHSNPIDILGDAPPERYRQATEAILKDRSVDGVLVLLTPQAMTDPTGCAQAIVDTRGKSTKPVLTCWMGESLVEEGRQILADAGIPHLRSPEAGVESFGYLACYHRNQKALLQAPGPLSEHKVPDVEGARLIIENVLSERRQTLNTAEAKAVLNAFQIPTSPTLNVSSAGEALVAAESVGLPVAMKINSPDITHKSDVGGVRLNINEPRSVRTAYREMIDSVQEAMPNAHIDGVTIEPMINKPHARELIIGVSNDPVFGPVISFGTGGIAVEVYGDSHVALPPLNEYLSKQLIDSTRASKMLGKFRNLPAANLDALINVLQRTSEIVCELPEIDELDINPVLLDDKEVIAVDARITVRPPKTSTESFGHMAIHPYPTELVSSWQHADGTDIVVRPIRPEDANIEQDFVTNLSAESKYFRFVQNFENLTPMMLARFTQIDYDTEMALIAVINDEKPNARAVGVARYVTNPDHESCEFALTVADDWQKHGIGRELMQRLMTIAKDRGIEIMIGEVLKNNSKMLKVCEKLGFRLSRDASEPEFVEVRRHL